jgi:hypothetical protein
MVSQPHDRSHTALATVLAGASLPLGGIGSGCGTARACGEAEGDDDATDASAGTTGDAGSFSLQEIS